MPSAYIVDFYTEVKSPLEFLRQFRGAFGRLLMGTHKVISSEESKRWYPHFFEPQKAPYGRGHRTRQPFILQYLGQNFYRFICLENQEEAMQILERILQKVGKYIECTKKIEVHQSQRIPLIVQESPGDLKPCPIGIEFKTPFILKELEEKMIESLTVEILWNAIFRHLKDELGIEYDDNLKTLSQRLHFVGNTLEEVRYSSFSGRQKKEFKDRAFIGRVVLPIEAWPFLPYLHLGQIFNFGKKRSFGFGSFQVFLLQ